MLCAVMYLTCVGPDREESDDDACPVFADNYLYSTPWEETRGK